MKKTYINPNMNVVELRMNTSLLTISGGGDSLNGGSNGTYSGGVTLGSREDDDVDW
jgi:hypothetical protein